MALVEDMLKGGNIMTGLAVGIGAAVVVPVLGPLLRPLAKSVIKAGIVAYDQGRAVMADLNERAGDMVSEVRSEMTHAGDHNERTSSRTKRKTGSASA